MRKAFALLSLMPILLILGCPENNNPSGPGGPTMTPTATSTATQCASYVGKTSASSSGYNGDRFEAQPVTLANSVTLIRLEMPLTEVDIDAQLQLAVYQDSTGTPGSLIVGSAVQNMVEGNNVVDISDTVLSPGVYWLAFLLETGAGGGSTLSTDGYVREQLDVLGVNHGKYYPGSNPAIGSLPDPFGAASDTTLAFVVYGVYCP